MKRENSESSDVSVFAESASFSEYSDFAAELPLISDYLTTVRLTTGGICAMRGIDVDYTEDIKVCVTEALLVLKRNGFARAKLLFAFSDGKISCRVLGVGKPVLREEKGDGLGEDEISFALLSALVEESRVKRDGETVAEIAFLA